MKTTNKPQKNYAGNFPHLISIPFFLSFGILNLGFILDLGFWILDLTVLKPCFCKNYN